VLRDVPTTVRLHPVGRCYAVIRRWNDEDCRYEGWYVNLEQPWVRTTVGYDTRDDVLDVTVDADLTNPALKDEDELTFAVETGQLRAQDARSIRDTADQAIDDVMQRRWPFDDHAWAALVPPPRQPLPVLPDGWHVP
jgi:predicted RNA-binding protein associated with RNAse of E/G family